MNYRQMKNLIFCTLLAVLNPLMGSAITFESKNGFAVVRHEIAGEGEADHVFKYSDFEMLESYCETTIANKGNDSFFEPSKAIA
jgi:hypothetical protein